jgi:hypothetical protein
MDTFLWLYGLDNKNRRSGRSYILALSYLQRAILNSPQWVDIEDHFFSREGSKIRAANDHLIGVIVDLAEQVGCRPGLEITQSRVRLAPQFRVTYAMVQAVTEFEPMVPIVPGKTIWEHLSEDTNG